MVVILFELFVTLVLLQRQSAQDRFYLWTLMFSQLVVLVMALWDLVKGQCPVAEPLEQPADLSPLELPCMMTRDELTGMYSREALLSLLPGVVERDKARNVQHGLVLVDIAQLRDINTEYGYRIGDAVMRLLSRILVNNCRPQDLIGRYGHSGFFVIMPHVSHAVARDTVDQIFSRVQALAPLPGKMQIYLKCGIAVSGSRIPSTTGLLNDAQEALRGAMTPCPTEMIGKSSVVDCSANSCLEACC